MFCKIRKISSLASITKPYLRRNFGFFSSKNTVKMIFINKDNTQTEVDAEIGKSLLDVAKHYDLEIEGACEASLACSTCHCILDEQLYEKLEEPCEEEEDLLDLAFGLTETSRLGCQVIVTEEFEGQIVRLPKATRNFYVDGKKPTSH